MISCGIRGLDYLPPCSRENHSRIMEFFSGKIVNVAMTYLEETNFLLERSRRDSSLKPLTEIREY